MDARPLAFGRLVLGAIALTACVTPVAGWHVAAAVVAALASLSLLIGWRSRLSALVAAGALTLAAPAHALLRLLLLLTAATDPGARGSLDAVLTPVRARARVAAFPVAILCAGAATGVALGLLHHRLTPIDLAAATSTLLVLLPGRLFTSLRAALARRTSPIDVIYDGKCSFCRRSVDTLLALDVLARIQPRDAHDPASRAAHPTLDPERAQREMLVFDGHRLEGGFDAFRLLAWKLPAAWIALPFLYLPPVPQVGRVVYGIVAANRLKLACELNLAPPVRPTPDPAPRTLPPLAGAALLVAAAGLETLLALGWL